MAKRPSYIRKSIYSIETVRELVQEKMFLDEKVDVNIDGAVVKANSQRYQVFFTKGCKCVTCGLEASHFALEKSYTVQVGQQPDRYHFNLYGMRDGKEVLFTKDHIIPKSRGGKDKYSNYQPMCCTCNKAKGNKMEVSA